jgi:hypothetical protein
MYLGHFVASIWKKQKKSKEQILIQFFFYNSRKEDAASRVSTHGWLHMYIRWMHLYDIKPIICQQTQTWAEGDSKSKAASQRGSYGQAKKECK